jgi:hypothetical protein
VSRPLTESHQDTLTCHHCGLSSPPIALLDIAEPREATSTASVPLSRSPLTPRRLVPLPHSSHLTDAFAGSPPDGPPRISAVPHAPICCQKGWICNRQQLYTKCHIPAQNHRRRAECASENQQSCGSGANCVPTQLACSLVRSLRMFFVFRCSHASGSGVLFAHVGPSLCAAIVPMTAEVINPGFRIRPYNGAARTMGFCLRFR